MRPVAEIEAKPHPDGTPVCPRSRQAPPKLRAGLGRSLSLNGFWLAAPVIPGTLCGGKTATTDLEPWNCDGSL